ncbi:MAG: HAD-IC family P-type ATPase [bacterium]|nr:HAD-IC family P-type ATPase [bacterium]
MSATAADLAGLTGDEVAQRVADGRVNDVPDAPVRTLGEIIRANVITPVNAILLSLLVLILVAGAPGDALFVGVVVSNSIIGIIQELRARAELRRLAVLSEPRARVRRDGEVSEIDVGGVVADDLLELASGDQVVVDGTVLAAVGLEVDESLLTGESDAISKAPDDRVMSGSFVAAGSGIYRAEGIGAASYAAELSEEARRFSLVDSELRRGVNRILRVLVWLIPPASALLLWRLLGAEDRWQEALRGTVGAAVAMVPDGLVLLTSLAFVAGVIALARRRALAKELAAVELLARVDTLCLDKTGTITTGEISFESLEPMGGWDNAAATDALGAMAASDPSPNATTAAVASACPPPVDWQVVAVEPFSSDRKWASAEFADRGLFYFGAPDILLVPSDGEARSRVEHWATAGRRVLLLSRANNGASGGDGLASDRRAVAVVVLGDTIRHDAPEILAYFQNQGVDLKVISGDNAATVSAVAQRAGVPGAEAYIDARELPTEAADLGAAMERNAVFGRVTPHQKRAMVGALQAGGRTVAMTGDGVNDVLALKDSDMGIAMGSGSAASRAVAELVVLDDSFATLPRVVDEGRKVINNVERVSNLFIAKAAYALLITAAIGIMGVSFPFLPRHLTLIGTFSIGVPGIFLALAPSTELVRPGFLQRVLRFSIPAGAVAAACTMVVYEVARRASEVALIEARTVATMTLLGLGLAILVVTSRPLRPWKIALAGVMGLLYVVVMVSGGLRDYFELDLPPAWLWGPMWAAIAVGGAAIVALPRFVHGPRRFGYRRSGSTGPSPEQVGSEPADPPTAAGTGHDA